MIRCGDVVRLFDASARGQSKDRMFLCLDPVQGWFARIVTRQPRGNPVRLARSEHQFLDHDSYVEIGTPAQYYDDEITEADEGEGAIGRITKAAARQILSAWEAAEVSPPAARDLVVQHLRESFSL